MDAPHPVHPVRIGAGVLGEVSASLACAGRAFVLSDANVAPLWSDALGVDGPRHVLPPGEGSKSFATLEQVLDAMAEAGLDRSSVLVALGGGVVGDLGGLAASLYMRGIDVVQCPTTLLAQVDSSVGGKTGVNLRAGKNLAGTFHAPRAVFADVATLATLPREELLSGLGEVVKTALVGGSEALAELERDAAALATGEDSAVLTRTVERCVAVKARVVAADEREAGPRKALNLGHTFGHAIEHAAGYGTIPHGVAVAVGVRLALDASRETGLLEEEALGARVASLLAALGLPASLEELRASAGEALPEGALLAGLRHDKKGAAGEPALVLVRRPGELALDVAPPAGMLERMFA